LIKTFISHTLSDHPFVEWLKTRLERENLGLDIFIDDDSVVVGDDPQKMIDEVKRSVIFIPVLSNESIQKEFVKNEIRTASANKTTHIFPIRLKCDDASIPEEFKINFTECDNVEGKIYEDFSDGHEWDMHYENLRRAIFNKIVELGLFKEDTKDYYQDCQHLDLILQRDEPTILEIKTVIDVYLKKEAYQRYFFSKLTNFRWLKYLKLYGYLRSNPQPIEAVNSPGLFTIPQWNALVYLERVSSQPDKNDEVINDLLNIIISVTSFKNASGQHIDNYRTWFYFVKILLNIPNNKIPSEIIDFIPIWLDSKFNSTLQGSEIAIKLLPKFLTDNPEDIKKAEKIIDYITAFKPVPLNEERAKLLGKKEEFRFIIDPHWLDEAFDKYSESIGEKCSEKVIKDLAGKIRSILTSEEDETYKSFYEEAEYPESEPSEVLTSILKRILLVKAKKDINTMQGILKDYFRDTYLYFPKMALYVMGQNMDKYSELFWEVLNTETGDLIMEETLHWGDELKHLLENLKNLTDAHRNILNKKIEGATKRHTFTEDQERDIALYKHKQKIYHVLSHDSYFKNLYDEMKKITKVDAALEPAVGKVETRWGPGPSPLAEEEILKLTNDKLAEFLATFETKDSWRGPTVGGLAGLVGKVAKEMPGKFIDDMKPFKDTDFSYIYEILIGIRDAWNEKKIIDWNKVFIFIKPYIDRKEFWEDKFIVEEDRANHHWIAGIVAELICDGARDDAWAFPEQDFGKVEEIVFLLLDNLKAEDDKDITDYVTYTLNTTLGKAITALILLALRIARVHDKKGIKNNIKWSLKFKEKYEELLSNKIIEGFTNLGRYLPNFYYLDKEWVKEKIKFLEGEKGSKYWEAFMDGYISIGMVYDEFYTLMKSHYQYSIEHDFKKKRDNEHLVQHIALSYLRKHESISEKGSLFKQILDKYKYEPIEDIIGFFWMQRKYLKEQTETDEDVRKRIIEFWRWLYEKYKKNTSLKEEDKKILSHAAKLAAILPQIDKENFEWLMLSAPYVHIIFNSFFIEYLDELKDKGDVKETAKYIGEIYLKMLDSFTPDFDQTNIRSIVEFLYKSSNRENANKICNIYGTRGYEFLRDIYGKHSSGA